MNLYFKFLSSICKRKTLRFSHTKYLVKRYLQKYFQSITINKLCLLVNMKMPKCFPSKTKMTLFIRFLKPKSGLMFINHFCHLRTFLHQLCRKINTQTLRNMSFNIKQKVRRQFHILSQEIICTGGYINCFVFIDAITLASIFIFYDFMIACHCNICLWRRTMF